MTDSSPPAKKKSQLPADSVLQELIHDPSPDVLIAVAGDARLSEDLALALLNRRDLPRQALEELHKNGSVSQQRKVQLAIVMHPRAPRHISVPTIRHLYPFELMQIALFPAVPADVKRAAEEVLISRMGSMSSGERFALAKQSSGRVAASLLLDKEERVLHAALANPRMTEALITKAVRAQAGTELLVPAVCRHEKWSRRNEIKMALLTNANTPLARVLQFAGELPVHALKDVLRLSRLSPNVKSYLRAALAKRAGLK